MTRAIAKTKSTDRKNSKPKIKSVIPRSAKLARRASVRLPKPGTQTSALARPMTKREQLAAMLVRDGGATLAPGPPLAGPHLCGRAFTPDLLARGIAWRLQEKALGGLTAEARRLLVASGGGCGGLVKRRALRPLLRPGRGHDRRCEPQSAPQRWNNP